MADRGINMTIDEFIEANNIAIVVEADLRNKRFFIRKTERKLEAYDLFKQLILYRNTECLLESITGRIMPKMWKQGATHCALYHPNDRQIIALFYDMDEEDAYDYAKGFDSQIKELFP